MMAKVPYKSPRSRSVIFDGLRRNPVRPSCDGVGDEEENLDDTEGQISSLQRFWKKQEDAWSSTACSHGNCDVKFRVWRARLAYILALVLIAALTIAALITIQLGLRQSSFAGNLVNQLGRQRYVSQLLSKDALKLLFYDNQPTQMVIVAIDMQTHAQIWNNSQSMLMSSPITDGVIQSAFIASDAHFQSMLECVVNMYSDILVNKQTEFTPQMQANLSIILANEGAYLTYMNMIVNETAILIDANISSVSLNEYVFEILILVILLCEGIFIYRPIDLRLGNLIRKVIREKERLVLVNSELENERNKTEDLLLNILPVTIARSLTENPNIAVSDLAEEKDVSVLFTDIVGFTTMSSNKTPSEVVKMLDSIFTEFDKICTRFRCDKIKTIGDAYMMVAGLSTHMENHAAVLCQAALELLNVEQLTRFGVSIRIGIASGPVVAGIVGKLKFAYDVWGDTVNMASRMESNGESGRVHIARSTKKLVSSHFHVSHSRELMIKGKGLMRTYFLLGLRSSSIDLLAHPSSLKHNHMDKEEHVHFSVPEPRSFDTNHIPLAILDRPCYLAKPQETTKPQAIEEEEEEEEDDEKEYVMPSSIEEVQDQDDPNDTVNESKKYTPKGKAKKRFSPVGKKTNWGGIVSHSRVSSSTIRAAKENNHELPHGEVMLITEPTS